MIISDQHRFAFVHIPKIAGTTIRAQLAPIDDRNGFYAARRVDAQGNERDYCHLTLAQIGRLYPDELERLKNYTTFCLVRDPAARFDAAVAEYAKQYLRREISTFSPRQRANLLKDIIEKLKYFGISDLPYWLVWFTPQVAFIEQNGERVASHVFPIDDLPRATALIYEKTGIQIDTQDRRNPRLEFRNGIGRRAAITGRSVKHLLPRKWYAEMRRTMRSALLETSYTPLDHSGRDNTSKNDFVREFYARDYAIWDSTNFRNGRSLQYV